jgi:hypothetical protein
VRKRIAANFTRENFQAAAFFQRANDRRADIGKLRQFTQRDWFSGFGQQGDDFLLLSIQRLAFGWERFAFGGNLRNQPNGLLFFGFDGGGLQLALDRHVVGSFQFAGNGGGFGLVELPG